MNLTRQNQPLGRHFRVRQWFGIELSAYVLICVFLITTAWTHQHVSGFVVVAAWAIGALPRRNRPAVAAALSPARPRVR